MPLAVTHILVPIILVDLFRDHILKKKGVYPLIKTIKKAREKNNSFLKKDAKTFNPLVAALNRACLYFPFQTKCLEWATALTLMALKRKWRCNLEIGVQNFPFAAHAWVKTYDGIVADQKELPEQLSVILSEPFSECVT